MRIVIKVGTSLLTTPDHRLDRSFLTRLVKHIVAIKNAGNEVIVVSSGAVAAGRGELGKNGDAPLKKNIPYRQALAALGQSVLMKTYYDLFKKNDISVAQALLTNYDFVNRENFLNTKNVFEVVLAQGAVPIVNENDVTTIAELKFGDNDMLSAKTAAMVSADFLFILTDVDGLYGEDPKKNPQAQVIATVKKIDEKILALAGGARSEHSKGGMITKLEAAQYVTSVGIPMFIVNGHKEKNLTSLVKLCTGASHESLALGTFFPSSVNPMESRKKWLRPKIQKNAAIIVDDGAANALRTLGKSLLPSGICGIEGDFNRGDVVVVKDSGREIAYGQVNYSAADLDKIKKNHSREIEKILGYSFEDEVIHRDRMVTL